MKRAYVFGCILLLAAVSLAQQPSNTNNPQDQTYTPQQPANNPPDTTVSPADQTSTPPNSQQPVNRIFIPPVTRTVVVNHNWGGWGLLGLLGLGGLLGRRRYTTTYMRDDSTYDERTYPQQQQRRAG